MDVYQWLLFLFCALLIGVGKAGISGMGLIVVPAMAAAFGGKVSTGLVLPMLVVADIMAVSYYRRHADWKYIWKLLPAATAGVFIGLWIGGQINDELFKKLIAFFIIGSLVLMLLQERGGLPPSLTGSWGFSAAFGLIGGISTMIGNAAGPIMAVYLLSTRLPKNNFIGTGAWFFLIVNLLKVPLHVFFWHTINYESLLLNLAAIPFIIGGIFLGIRIVQLLPEKAFRYFVMIMTLLLSLKLVL